jgi:rhodanese-related sulfurtransferase
LAQSIVDDLQISPAEAKAHLERGDGVLLVDVREPWETQLCRIEGAILMPMGTVPANVQKLDVDSVVICYCHHGIRSLDVAVWLRSQGVERARSMTGGIDRWSSEIDPGVPRY